MASYAEMLRGGSRGGRSGPSSSPRPIHEAPLNHVPALNENAIFIDLKVVKEEFSMQERNDQRVQVLEVLIISKAWYFSQVIPLPAATFRSLM
jgi:hypothetical protein